MLYRYGQLPVAPVIGDAVIINEPAVALSRGQGLIAPGFRDSAFGLDQLYAHFPPVYIFAESLAFRAFGVSVYSLRLVTTVMGIASAGFFLLLMWCLCQWGLADWGTSSIAACLYTLNATMLVLHRLARMESTVECLALSSLLCVLTGIFSGTGDPSSGAKSQPWMKRDERRRLIFMLAGAVLAGVSIVTHPEALTALLPTMLLILLAAPVSWRNRAFLLATLGFTPVAIWLGTYGARWKQAIAEMNAIHRYTAPPAGILSFARDFSLETHRNISQGMRATLFVLCLLVLGSILVRWMILKRATGNAAAKCQRNSIEAAPADRNFCIFGNPQPYRADMVYGGVCYALPGNIPHLFGTGDITSRDLSKKACRALGWRYGWDSDTYSTLCDGDLSPKRRRSAR